MPIATLILASTSQPLNREMVERAREEARMSLPEIYDAFAQDVAEKYLGGKYPWGFCDAAMNSLFSYAHPVSLSGLPPFAFEIYCLFDAGEHRREGDARSKRLVADALTRKNSNPQTPAPMPATPRPAARFAPNTDETTP